MLFKSMPFTNKQNTHITNSKLKTSVIQFDGTCGFITSTAFKTSFRDKTSHHTTPPRITVVQAQKILSKQFYIPTRPELQFFKHENSTQVSDKACCYSEVSHQVTLGNLSCN